jgi:hypothetical protein
MIEEKQLMRVVGEALGISIQAPHDAYFSYFNSPYIGHNLGAAIDIYPKHQEWGGPVFAPVSGKITRIKKIHMGRSKPFPTEVFEYGIAIQVERRKEDIVRVLHCEPIVKEGEKVDLGDQIGHAIRSRYFNFWTGPHYHVEIMPINAFSRSTKSYLLEVPMVEKQHNVGYFHSPIELSITDVSDDRAIGYSKDCSFTSIGDINGLSAYDENGSALGIIDGGLSHYQHGGVIGKQNTKEGDLVHFGGYPVGMIATRRDRVSHFQRGPSIKATINGLELLGLSCFLYPPQYSRKGTPQIILIPREYRGFRNLIENDSIGILEISGCSN